MKNIINSNNNPVIPSLGFIIFILSNLPTHLIFFKSCLYFIKHYAFLFLVFSNRYFISIIIYKLISADFSDCIRHFLSGASTSEKFSTKSGRRCPLTSNARIAELSSVSSSDVNLTSAAPLLSSKCAICVVPGIGTIQGFCANSHASAI